MTARSLPVRLLRRLRETRGAAAVEFALVAPVFVMMIFGIAQLGILYYAHAGLRNAVSTAARQATLYPRPTAAQIRAVANANRGKLVASRFSQPVVSFGIQDGANFAEVTMTYRQPLNFLFFEAMPVTLSYTRRAYIPPAPVTP